LKRLKLEESIIIYDKIMNGEELKDKEVYLQAALNKIGKINE
jgi:hypothetical protein